MPFDIEFGRIFRGKLTRLAAGPVMANPDRLGRMRWNPLWGSSRCQNTKTIIRALETTEENRRFAFGSNRTLTFWFENSISRVSLGFARALWHCSIYTYIHPWISFRALSQSLYTDHPKKKKKKKSKTRKKKPESCCNQKIKKYRQTLPCQISHEVPPRPPTLANACF